MTFSAPLKLCHRKLLLSGSAAIITSINLQIMFAIQTVQMPPIGSVRAVSIVANFDRRTPNP